VAVGLRVEVVCVLLALGAGAGCHTPDPAKELAVSDLEAYWVVDTPSGGEQFLAPAVRMIVKNRGARAAHSLEATAVFRRQGEESKTWGSDWRRVLPSGRSLEPGQETVLVLKSDARYHSQGDAESMFRHELFKDATVEVFLRLGSSPWTKFGHLEVARRVGSKTLAAESR
jgi:hypothetical protein